MQQDTITLTQYWEQMEEKMKNFLADNLTLEDKHPAKIAANALIQMGTEAKKLELATAGTKNTFSEGWALKSVGPDVQKKMEAFSINIGEKNPQTENYIPIKTDDPIYKNFVKAYLSGLKEFSRIKSSSQILQDGAFGKPGISDAQKKVPLDIAAIEANYSEFGAQAVEDKVIGPGEDKSANPQNGLTPENMDQAQDEKSPNMPVAEEKHSEIPDQKNELDDFENIERDYFEKIAAIDEVSRKLLEQMEELSTKIRALEEELQKESSESKKEIELKNSWRAKITKPKQEDHASSCNKKTERYLKIQEEYQSFAALLKENSENKKHLFAEYIQKKSQHEARKQEIEEKRQQRESKVNEISSAADMPVSRPVVNNGSIITAVIGKVPNWTRLDEISQKKTREIIDEALDEFNLLAIPMPAVVDTIVDKVIKALYPKTFSKNYGIYLGNYGCSARFFGTLMRSAGETLSKMSLEDTIQQTTQTTNETIPPVASLRTE